MNSSQTRVATYLDDLARMLADLDPRERDDVLAGIREHLDAEIGSGEGGDAVAQAALLRLGPPEEIAAEARRGTQPQHGSRDPARTVHPHVATSASGTAWARVAVVTTLLATLPFLTLAMVVRVGAIGAIGYSGMPGSSGMAGWPHDVGLLVPHGAEVALLMPIASPLWVVALVCTLAAAPLRWRTRLRLAAVGPAAFAVVNLSVFWASPGLLSGIVSAALSLATGVGAVVVGRSAWRESSACAACELTVP